MPAGWLRERVTLQKRDPSASSNAYNEAVESWVTVLEDVPAQVYALNGREFHAAAQVQAATTHRVVIRTHARVAIRPEYRFAWTERLTGGTDVEHFLDIKQVVPLVSKRGYTECLCTEHIDGG